MRSQASTSGRAGLRAGYGATAWEREFDRWLRPFWTALGDKRRQRWAPVYARGLVAPGERKSIEPLAARVAPDDGEQLHHFVCTSCWNPAPLERVLAQKAQRLVGGSDAVLIVDDTALLKQGTHSVGVARQYAGAAGKTTNCQTLVSLTLAGNEVPVCLALRLFLPAEWADDPARCRTARIPTAHLVYRTKGDIALEEIDRVVAAGVTFGCILADTGYGASAQFRRALSARGYTWAMGVSKIQKVYPADVRLRMPRTKPGSRPRIHPVPTRARVSAEELLASMRWRAVTWREGTKGPLRARFAAVRVVVADGVVDAGNRHLPGAVAWLVGEARVNGVRKYYLTNHPASASLRTLAAAIKARWSCEQVHQQLKEELGLDHFEGRSWLGLHHHALLTMISFAFLQHLRLGETRRREKNPARAASRQRPPARTLAPGDSAHADHARARPTPLPDMPRAAHV